MSAGLDRADAYGRAFADVYDEWYDGVTDAAATARIVAEHASPGYVLELGIGTGRLARPLAERGMVVVGVDASAEMLARAPIGPLGDGAVLAVRADMSALPLRAGFGAALIGFNTLFNLPTAQLQAALFEQLAAVVAPGGSIVVEALDGRVLGEGPRRSVAVSRHLDGGIVAVGTAVDPSAQTIVGQHLDVTSSGLRSRPWLLRWSTPEEIDGYAATAGFALVERRPTAVGADALIGVYRRSTPTVSP